VQRQDLLRYHRFTPPHGDAARQDRARRAALSVPGGGDRRIRAPLSEPEGSRVGPGRAAEHGRAEVRDAEDSRGVAPGRRAAGRLAPRALEPGGGLPRRAQSRTGADRRRRVRLLTFLRYAVLGLVVLAAVV